jgi:hypothetical protein
VSETTLSAWESYYVIVGSSAAALTGLQFVVIALIAQSERGGGHQEIAAFGTPTIVYFCASLLVSAALSAPWGHLAGPAIVVALTGALGVLYSCISIRRQRRQQGYQPVFEDWLWHAILSTIAYAALMVSGLALPSSPMVSLFVIAGAALLLLFIGIHNAWDTVTFLAVGMRTTRTSAASTAPNTALIPAPTPEPTLTRDNVPNPAPDVPPARTESPGKAR